MPRTLTLKLRFVIAGLLACGVFVTCVVLAITTFAHVNALSQGASRDKTVERLVTDAYEQWTLDDDQSNMFAALVALQDPTQRDLETTTWKQATNGYAAAQKDMAEIGKWVEDDAEKTVVDRLNADLESYNGFSQQAYTAAGQNDVQGVVHIMTVDNLKPSNDLPEAFAALQKQEVEKASADEASLSHSLRNGKLELIAVGLVGGLALIAVLMWLAAGVLRPLAGLRNRMAEIAHGDGDLTARVEVKRRDEVGELATAFNDFVQRMQGLLAEVSTNSDTLRRSVADLGAISTQLGQGASETTDQARAVADATASINENLVTVAAGATQLHASVDEISRSANEAARASSDAVDAAQQASVTAATLQQASGEIQQILKLISAIAEQTNLLALNATIEAARAGEAGKGFAVVADEVKQLAGQTTRATTEITDKIAAIEASTTAVLSAIENTVASIGKINGYSSAIAAAVEEQTATTAELSRTIEETAQSTGGIAVNVEHVANTAQEASEGVGQTQECASDLDVLAVRVDELVGAFKF